jgi:hypothetical protein
VTGARLVRGLLVRYPPLGLAGSTLYPSEVGSTLYPSGWPVVGGTRWLGRQELLLAIKSNLTAVIYGAQVPSTHRVPMVHSAQSTRSTTRVCVRAHARVCVRAFGCVCLALAARSWAVSRMVGGSATATRVSNLPLSLVGG